MAFGKSPAVLAALGRRASRAGQKKANIKWFIEDVSNKIAIPMRKRVAIATEFVKSKVIENVSTPVTKSGGRVTDRSKPGEFPRADTTQLMKTIFGETKEVSKGVFDGYIGTPLDYGLILETRRNRSFLKRTFNEELGKVTAILSGPVK